MVATGFEEALTLLESQCPQLLLLDPNAASMNSSQPHKLNCQGPVVAVTTFDTLDAAVNALKGNGARTTVRAGGRPPRAAAAGFWSSVYPAATASGLLGSRGDKPGAHGDPGVDAEGSLLRGEYSPLRRIGHRERARSASDTRQ